MAATRPASPPPPTHLDDAVRAVGVPGVDREVEQVGGGGLDRAAVQDTIHNCGGAGAAILTGQPGHAHVLPALQVDEPGQHTLGDVAGGARATHIGCFLGVDNVLLGVVVVGEVQLDAQLGANLEGGRWRGGGRQGQCWPHYKGTQPLPGRGEGTQVKGVWHGSACTEVVLRHPRHHT